MGVEYELRETKQYSRWIRKASRDARLEVAIRLTKVENGNLGDHKSVVIVFLNFGFIQAAV